jgi:hypothetical protein
MEWLVLIVTISLVIVAAASVIALICMRKALQRRSAAQTAGSVRDLFEAERVLWLNALADREMTALLAIRLTLTTDFLGAQALKAESAIRILLMLRQYENAHEQYVLGQLTASAWESSMNEMMTTFQDRRSRAVYDRSQALFSRQFAAFVTTTLLP